jgi:hypothetical protein
MNGMEVDATEFYRLCDMLDAKNLKKSFRKPLAKAGSVLKRQVVSAMHATGYNIPTSDNKFIVRKVWLTSKRNKDQSGVTVAFSNSKKKGKDDRGYVLRFLSQGTVNRTTKKGWRRGALSQTNYFPQAVSTATVPSAEELKKNVLSEMRSRLGGAMK